MKEQSDSDAHLRVRLTKLLAKDLKTEVEPRAYTHESIIELVAKLKSLEDTDYENKFIISGFTPDPYVTEDGDEQACETCMYYRVHQRFCEIPELMVPVEPEWSCRLWRI